MKNQNTENKKTALVLSGGGSRGAYEAGACQALAELGIKIDIITGTSVGADSAD
ncbi:MAG: patatin-like phospholipase family protein, partial [Firmicutes bacterium]|nr:patatin-like phospholipase family protein [Bacillota bacterium]